MESIDDDDDVEESIPPLLTWTDGLTDAEVANILYGGTT